MIEKRIAKPLDRSRFAPISVPVATEPHRRESSLPKYVDGETRSRPFDANWLLNPAHIAISGLPASQAFSLIAPGQTIRFDLRLGDDPLLTYDSGPTATTQDVLNDLAAQADWSYEFNDGILRVHDLETRTLPLLAQPGSVAAKLSVNSLDAVSSGASESDGGTVQQESDPYQSELNPLLHELIAADAKADIPASVQLLPNANAVLVTARPSTG